MSAFSTFAMLRSFADIIEGNDARVDTDAELTYYLNVKEDGVDAAGIESSDIQVASIYSGRISVTDRIPDGLEFQGFITTSDGTFGAVSRSDSSIQCSGKVIDDTNEDTLNTGTWNNTHTEYYYHGLHYDDATRTVSFTAEKLKAGCQLTIGIITRTPATVDDPDTTVVETRRDFYNSAFAAEKNITTISNTVHAWIGNSSARVFKVRYSYTGNIPSGAPTTPTEQSHPANNEVAVSMNPSLEGYTFSGWTTTDATITDGRFAMPGQDVELVGIWTKNTTNTKYNVTYVVNGDKPTDFMPPAQKEYEAGTTVDLDSTEKDTVIDGYRFSGWSTTDAELSETGFTMPEGNVTITGSFERISYKVCYEFEGTVSPDDANSLLPPCETYYPGDTVTRAADPQADGYNFLGWYKNASFTMPEGNVTIQGEWTRAMDKFTPSIAKIVVDPGEGNNGSEYMYGETVKFKVTVTNTAAYEIMDVYLQEELDGAIFTAPADDSYTVKTSTIAFIPTIAANSSLDVYAEYKVTENTAQTLTNTVELTGALAEDNVLDTNQEYKATVNFNTIPEPVPLTGIIFNALPYVGLVGLGVGILIILFTTSRKLGLREKLSYLKDSIYTHQAKIRQGKLNYMLPILAIASIVAGGLIVGLTSATNYTEVIKSIELTSQHVSYANNDPGSWHVTKSAKWIEQDKARITFDVNTVIKANENIYRDIVMVIDSSGSMSGEKIARVKHDATELVEEILADTGNRIALINFNSSANIMSGLSNNKTSLLSLINNISPHDYTNYYDGFLKAEEVLEGYQKQENRELILLFLTDGFPNEQTPNEIAEYQALKAEYPYIVVNGIQYEMGDRVLMPIKRVSDNQFIASMDSLRSVLFEAATMPYTYDDFTITDYINDEYWDVDSVDNITTSLGEASLAYDGDTPVVTWAMGGVLISGHAAQLTIDVTLKNANLLNDEGFLPTNSHETVQTSVLEVPNENIFSELTPVLKTSFRVSYEANLPSDCSSYEGTVPIEQNYQPLAVVQKSNNTLSCSGYNFDGWVIAKGDPKIINDDYFKVANDDVVLRAVWSKVSIAKSMDGEVDEEAVATLDTGQNVNVALKRLTGQTDVITSTANTTVSAVKAATSMNPVQEASATTISAANSPVPIYAWFDDTDGVIYIYTEADKIKTGSLANLFDRFTRLADISGLAGWDVSNTTNMGYAFYGNKFTNIDDLANWNTSKVTNMTQMFYNCSAMTNIDGAANWDTSKVTNMSYMFRSASKLTNIDGAANWDTSRVTTMYRMFFGASSLTNIDGASNWDLSSLTNMSTMFQDASSLVNIDGATNWNTSKVTTMYFMFLNVSSLTNIDGASNWDTSSVTSMDSMFYGASSLTNIDGAANWNVSNVANMDSMFRGASSLTDISALSSWDTSNVKKMSSMFSGASSLTDIDGATNWDTSSVTTMSQMFQTASSLANIDGATNWNTSNVTLMNYMFSGTKITNTDALAEWNTSSVTDMAQMFSGTFSLVDIDGLANWNTSSVTTMASTFYNTKITDVYALTDWDTGNVTDMSSMFFNTRIASIDALADWDTGSVTDMSAMFRSAINLVNIDGALGWDTSSVTTMYRMFFGASSLADVNGAVDWDTSNVTNMANLFENAKALINIDGVADWDVSNVKNMSNTFNGVAITSLDALANWRTGNVTNMSNMFDDAKGFTDIDALIDWDMSKVINMNMMFRGTKITNIDGALNWDTSSVENMNRVFFIASSLRNIDGAINWNTTKVTDMSGMFRDAQKLANIDGAARWDVSNVTDMSEMFYTDYALTNINGALYWNTGSVTNMASMFYNANKLTDISGATNWNVSNVTDMSGIFRGVSRLASVEAIASWNTGSVTNMNNLFKDASSVTTFSPLDGWDTASVTSKTGAFDGVSETAPLPTWY